MTNNIISIEGSLQNVTSFEGKSCAQDMREADQEFVRDLMERIEEETCLKFTEKKGYLKSNCWDLDCRRSSKHLKGHMTARESRFWLFLPCPPSPGQL